MTRVSQRAQQPAAQQQQKAVPFSLNTEKIKAQMTAGPVIGYSLEPQRFSVELDQDLSPVIQQTRKGTDFIEIVSEDGKKFMLFSRTAIGFAEAVLIDPTDNFSQAIGFDHETNEWYEAELV